VRVNCNRNWPTSVGLITRLRSPVLNECVDIYMDGWVRVYGSQGQMASVNLFRISTSQSEVNHLAGSSVIPVGRSISLGLRLRHDYMAGSDNRPRLSISIHRQTLLKVIIIICAVQKQHNCKLARK